VKEHGAPLQLLQYLGVLQYLLVLELLIAVEAYPFSRASDGCTVFSEGKLFDHIRYVLKGLRDSPALPDIMSLSPPTLFFLLVGHPPLAPKMGIVVGKEKLAVFSDQQVDVVRLILVLNKAFEAVGDQRLVGGKGREQVRMQGHGLAGESADAIADRLMADPEQPGGCTNASAIGQVVEDPPVGELSLDEVVEAEGLFAEGSAAAEACEACHCAVDLALIASGDMVPAACDGQCGVVGALGIGTKWGN